MIFLSDQLNEEALSYKCRSLIFLGRHSLAKDAYTKFAKEYRENYGQDFERSFELGYRSIGKCYNWILVPTSQFSCLKSKKSKINLPINGFIKLPVNALRFISCIILTKDCFMKDPLLFSPAIGADCSMLFHFCTYHSHALKNKT